MAPLADAVRLVHGKVANANTSVSVRPLETFKHIAPLELFRGEIHQFVVTLFHTGEPGLSLVIWHIPIDKGAHMIEPVPPLNSFLVLIDHQGLERCHDDGDAGKEYGRQNETFTLPASSCRNPER